VATWPVFLDRTMHEDMGVLFGVGETVSWDVILVNGEAEGLAGRPVGRDRGQDRRSTRLRAP
jgi:hypothetical protein